MVDILLITHNRLTYVVKTLPRLLESDGDFQVFWWDNGSTDGTRDFVSSIQDPRIVKKNLSEENVLQDIPARWFLENSHAEIVGKIDDDTLVPKGWISKINPLVSQYHHVGMIGCWTFWLEDFQNYEKNILKEVVKIEKHHVIRDVSIGGSAVLISKKHALKYIEPKEKNYAFPIDQYKMSRDGLINGWYYPLLWAEHMDDPRSQHCLMRFSQKEKPLTAQRRNIESPEKYLQWIKADVQHRFTHTYQQKLRSSCWQKSWMKKFFVKIKKLVNQ